MYCGVRPKLYMDGLAKRISLLIFLRQPGRLFRQRLDGQPFLAFDVRLQHVSHQAAVAVHVVTGLGQQRHDFIV